MLSKIFGNQNQAFYKNKSKKFKKLAKLLNCCVVKIHNRAAQNKQTGCQFDMPGVNFINIL